MATQRSTGSKQREATPTRGNPAPRGGSASASGSGTSDEVYGLVSVLYHALQGAETYGKYIEDARRSSDPKLQKFFQQCQSEEKARAESAKRLLAERLGDVEDEDEDEEGDDEDDDDEDEDEEEEDED